ncbi:hypothetical protein B0P06_004418 [Clostridium saccharoperbutylacetonicum]|nr:hypothetical protein [Clostridium saccharoperbutylacetonicum]NSB25278.1 hypothetical protein [Clostridium saccharoperbutylacetonicum]NSB44647.1 hypothetical protein [Clostridium saccharoperbutylacetonicum]
MSNKFTKIGYGIARNDLPYKNEYGKFFILRKIC